MDWNKCECNNPNKPFMGPCPFCIEKDMDQRKISAGYSPLPHADDPFLRTEEGMKYTTCCKCRLRILWDDAVVVEFNGGEDGAGIYCKDHVPELEPADRVTRGVGTEGETSHVVQPPVESVPDRWEPDLLMKLGYRGFV